MISRNETKYIQSLFQKKNRDTEGLFIAEGVKLIDELLASDVRIHKIYAVEEWIEKNPAVKEVTEISIEELKKISRLETPNKVLAVAEKKILQYAPNLSGKITLLLDGIQDPGNVGTIIRTADWFGIENIIAAKDTADMYNPKVIQSTMGSFLRINIFYEDEKEFLLKNKIAVYGAALNGDDISTLNNIEECILIIGNESKGIRKETAAFVEKKITIPKLGKAESLNAAVATGIILWKLCKQ